MIVVVGRGVILQCKRMLSPVVKITFKIRDFYRVIDLFGIQSEKEV